MHCISSISYINSNHIITPKIYSNYFQRQQQISDVAKPGMQSTDIKLEISTHELDSDIESLLTTHEIVEEAHIIPIKAHQKHKTKPITKKFKPKQQSIELKPISIFNLVEKEVPERKQQLREVCDYIDGLSRLKQAPLCINGSTGCGKTSMMIKIMECLKRNQLSSLYQSAYINCMRVLESNKIYSCILEKIFYKTNKNPQKALETLFLSGNSEGSPKVIVLDEIDQFITKKGFLYNILEWVHNSKCSVGLILISNKSDLSVNLSAKLKSRMKFNSLTFAPYPHESLHAILRYKYKQEIDLADEDALVYLCKKIAGANSDFRVLERYFLQAIRQAEELESQKVDILTIQHILRPNVPVHAILEPYRFMLDVIINSPKKSDVSQEIRVQYRLTHREEANDAELLHLLMDLRGLGLVVLSENLALSHCVFDGWGVTATDFAYLNEIRE